MDETVTYRRRHETNSFHPTGPPVSGSTRPRIEGAREREIFGTAIGLLGEVGYDRLTFDEISARAGTSKASLYRRWGDKAALIDAAIDTQSRGDVNVPDTGSVVDDLAALCTSPDFFDVGRAAIISGLATALHREPHQHEAARHRLVHDGTKHVRAVLTRAVDRGELTDDLDVDLVSAVIPAMVLFQMTYQTPGEFTEDFVPRIIAQIINPVLQQHERRHRGSADRR